MIVRRLPFDVVFFTLCFIRFLGLTENAGHENDGPSKLQDMKLQDMKLTDQCAGHANAGHKIDGPIFEEFARHEIVGRENEGPICRA